MWSEGAYGGTGMQSTPLFRPLMGGEAACSVAQALERIEIKLAILGTALKR